MPPYPLILCYGVVMLLAVHEIRAEDPQLLASIDFDHDAWRIQHPYNTIRKGGKITFPTLEQGKWYPPRIVPREEPDNGAIWYGLPASDAPKDRVESILVRDVPLGVTRFSSFAVRFPKDLPKVPEDGWFLFHQWHQSSPESPPLALQIKPGTNDQLMISYRFSGEDGKQRRRLRFRKLPLEVWVSFIVKWRFDPHGKGEAVIWMNEEEIFSYQGPLGFAHVEDQKIDEKFGIYRKGAPTAQELLYDEIRLETDRASVTPPTPKPAGE
ncbi:MAG: heparin lyase I family protein [Verrucomicrobiota bacterium]